jgi:uncharacterized protein (DUF1501 family)
MAISRREFSRLIAGAGALSAVGQLGRSAAVAAAAPTFRAMVGVFLFGGNDSWNMVAPIDARHETYAKQRGAKLALPKSSLSVLTGSAFGLHPSLGWLKPVWDDGGLGVVLNTGTLFQPMNRALYMSRPDLRPLNLMSHDDEQTHWQGMQARSVAVDGYMGRIADWLGPASMPRAMSAAGSELALIGKEVSPLILSSRGTILRKGYDADTPYLSVKARQAALAAFADGDGLGVMTLRTAKSFSDAYAQAAVANDIVAAETSPVDRYFKHPDTGAVLTSDIARQLQRVARLIAARGTLGHNRQIYFASQGGYDTHSGQVNAIPTQGRHANLYDDLGLALRAFYYAMRGIGLGDSVTAFTMSDFGRIYKANGQNGTDHAWGGNHLVVGNALASRKVHGRYPDMVFGGPEDIADDGRWIPSIAQEEYIGAITHWFGVSKADFPYIFPNWSTWNGGGRGLLPLFA